MKALEKTGMWELVDQPINKKITRCKCVITEKYKEYGTVDEYKARLVTKGFTQTYGVDYIETFAPIAKLNTKNFAP